MQQLFVLKKLVRCLKQHSASSSSNTLRYHMSGLLAQSPQTRDCICLTTKQFLHCRAAAHQNRCGLCPWIVTACHESKTLTTYCAALQLQHWGIAPATRCQTLKHISTDCLWHAGLPRNSLIEVQYHCAPDMQQYRLKLVRQNVVSTCLAGTLPCSHLVMSIRHSVRYPGAIGVEIQHFIHAARHLRH